MPTYEYKCEQCGQFEKVQPITADPLTGCPTCGGAVERLISRNVNILFKGSGFHITDYRSPGYKSDASNGESKGDKKPGGETSADKGSSDAAKSESQGKSKGSAAGVSKGSNGPTGSTTNSSPSPTSTA